jgi:hypothetical protein
MIVIVVIIGLLCLFGYLDIQYESLVCGDYISFRVPCSDKNCIKRRLIKIRGNYE